MGSPSERERRHAVYVPILPVGAAAVGPPPKSSKPKPKPGKKGKTKKASVAKPPSAGRMAREALAMLSTPQLIAVHRRLEREHRLRLPRKRSRTSDHERLHSSAVLRSTEQQS